ncbi:hypothetical protein [Shimia sagamensis]|uniref:Amino acid ABC transporter permease n=1 Tax=Shimia sagamensis TaxID=1566352 RepID=A0ABY1NMZ2_9RHOB|nr:hypothetical protein [Shimia sagamensis]SMP13694.1 hypothetical protein SAMN06265373_102565 [Shimia sagamensis]
MEAILNVFWSVIEALPPVVSASVLMLGISVLVALLLGFIVASLASGKEVRS